MKGSRGLWDPLDLPGESLPGQVLVEITGQNRVLVEHHQGVREYSHDKIGIRVKYGTVLICGRELELRHMSREQLVISGTIRSVELKRREEP